MQSGDEGAKAVMDWVAKQQQQQHSLWSKEIYRFVYWCIFAPCSSTLLLLSEILSTSYHIIVFLHLKYVVVIERNRYIRVLVHYCTMFVNVVAIIRKNLNLKYLFSWLIWWSIDLTLHIICCLRKVKQQGDLSERECKDKMIRIEWNLGANNVVVARTEKREKPLG